MVPQQALDFLREWGFALLGAALVLVALLVNLVAPQRRRRIRYALFLYGLFLAASGASALLSHLSAPTLASWGEHVRLVGDICAAFLVVNLIVLVLFDVALPALGVRPAAITGDVVVGLLYLFAGLGVLKAAGFSPTSVVTTSAVVTGILALSLQTTLGNIIGGVALQLDGSVHVDDWVQLPDGTQGKVMSIRWRHTVLETRNWDTIVVPNANLLAQNIIILGKRTGKPVQHRMWVYFNVDFRFAPSQVIDVVREALWAAPIEGAADDPKPSVICHDFAKDGRDSFGYYAVRYWLTDLPNDDPTNSRIRTRIYTALKRANIPLARPVQTLFMKAEEDEAVHATRLKEKRVHAVESVELFSSLTPEERSFVADHLRYAPFTAGETCTKQGAVAHWLYILTAGKVEIRRHHEGDAAARAVATIEAPSFFGEMGLMTGEPRTADVVALTDVECYRLDKVGVQKVLTERPEAAAAFSKTLAARRVDLASAVEDLDAEARKSRMESEETRILDRIQDFFGLARTTKV
ncbi:MAG TPA: mechanosensitive ion channel family protein [Polyangiaceae bacterium]|nr:mechanosensitive ion channel family protein [Polyangiaceae bacterium]